MVSLHVPLNSHTHHLINAGVLAQMKRGAVLVNTCRGGVVDTAAVADALASGQLYGAGLDVFEEEPLDLTSPLIGCENAVLTPHAAWYSEESYAELKRRTVENVLEALARWNDAAQRDERRSAGMSAALLNSTMRAAVWTAPDTIEPRQLPVPEIPSGWALVRTEMTGLCGSDFSILHGTHPRAEGSSLWATRSPASWRSRRRPARRRAPGSPCSSIHCGECHPCSGGDTHVCRALKLYGIDVAGSLAEYVALPASALIPVSNAVPLQEAALAEPLAVAVHAVSLGLAWPAASGW